MKQLIIAEQVFTHYPSVELGVIILHNLDNTIPAVTNNLLQETMTTLRKNLTIETLPELPVIQQWRNVYQSFGATPPSTYRSSIEALLRRILKGDLPNINFLVDLYNYASIKHLIPIGAEDLDTIEGDIHLCPAEGNEQFFTIGSTENSPPKAKEIIYKDNKGTICRCWNWREGDRTKITPSTKNAIIVIENIIPNTKEKLFAVLQEITQLLQQHTKTIITTHMMNKNNRIITI